MSSTRRGPDLVLYVGCDDDGALSCAKVTALPVLRSRHLRVAAERVRSMRPVLVVVGPDVTRDEVEALRTIARETRASLKSLDEMSVASAR